MQDLQIYRCSLLRWPFLINELDLQYGQNFTDVFFVKLPAAFVYSAGLAILYSVLHYQACRTIFLFGLLSEYSIFADKDIIFQPFFRLEPRI